MVAELKNDMDRLNLALAKIGGLGEKDHKAGLGVMNRHKNAYGIRSNNNNNNTEKPKL